MSDVSIFRLYLLRAVYLVIFVGLGFDIWPALIQHPLAWTLWHGVGCSLLAAMSLLVLLGLRYPLQMLPLLLFETVWKAIWLIVIAYPLWIVAWLWGVYRVVKGWIRLNESRAVS